MRLWAVAAFVLGAGAGSAAQAQSGAFTPQAGASQDAVAFVQAAPRADLAAVETLTQLDPARPLAADMAWRDRDLALRPTKDGSAFDSIRLSIAEPVLTPDGRPLNLSPGLVDDGAYEVKLTRDWPGRWRFAGDRFDLDVSPHAGVGMGMLGGSAEAGATVRLGHKLDDAVTQRLADMGVRDGSNFGNEGRWYLFAAASGRAVGLNMLRDGGGGWDRAGWSTDPAASVIADAHVGVGWRRGAMQTSFGVIHREVKGEHMLWGQETKANSLVAFSFSIKPKR